MNRQGRWSMLSYPDLRYYTGICQIVGAEIKVPLSLSLIMHRIINTHGVKALDGDVWSVSHSCRSYPSWARGNYWMGERVGHTTGMDDLKNRIISAHTGNRDVVQHVTWCQIIVWCEVVLMYARRKWEKTRILPCRTAGLWAEVRWHS